VAPLPHVGDVRVHLSQLRGAQQDMSRSSGLLHSKGPFRLVAVGENRAVCTAGSLIALPSVCHCQIKRSHPVAHNKNTCSSSICLIDAFPGFDLGRIRPPHFSPGSFPSSEQMSTFTSYIPEGKQAPLISSSATDVWRVETLSFPPGWWLQAPEARTLPRGDAKQRFRRRVARWR
jgi:hypothetical protein